MIDFKDYSNNVLITSSDEFHIKNIHPDLTHGIIGLSTEAAELLDLLKKKIYYNKEITRENIIDEVGDNLWYIALILRSVDATLDEVLEYNQKKLFARYPDRKFIKENAIDKGATYGGQTFG